MKNPCLAAVLTELRRAGTDFVVTRSRRHPRILFGAGLRRWITVAGTPGDVRSVKNARAQIRRALREMCA